MRPERGSCESCEPASSSLYLNPKREPGQLLRVCEAGSPRREMLGTLGSRGSRVSRVNRCRLPAAFAKRSCHLRFRAQGFEFTLKGGAAGACRKKELASVQAHHIPASVLAPEH